MDWFELHCRCLEPPDLVLHIGAGSGAELEVYRRLQQCRVILVEPQADSADRLRRETATMPHVDVLQLAITSVAGEALLQRFNLAGFSSLRRPTGLTDLFPGLVSIGSVPIDTVSLSQLVRRYSIEKNTYNWLIIDAPGAEPDLIDALKDDWLTPFFSEVFLFTCTVPLFDGVETATGTLKELHQLGYESFGAEERTDPDFPRFHVRLNRSALEAAVLRDQLSGKESELSALLSENKRQLAGFQADLQGRDRDMAELRQIIDGLELRLSQNKDQIDRQVSELAARDESVSRLRGELENARSQNQDLAAAHESLSHKLEELKVAADKTTADLSVALRLQALRDADLKELQERYAAAVTLRDQQRELLVKLRIRLDRAARYLQEFTARGTADDDVARSLVGALTGEHGGIGSTEELEAKP